MIFTLTALFLFGGRRDPAVHPGAADRDHLGHLLLDLQRRARSSPSGRSGKRAARRGPRPAARCAAPRRDRPPRGRPGARGAREVAGERRRAHAVPMLAPRYRWRYPDRDAARRRVPRGRRGPRGLVAGSPRVLARRGVVAADARGATSAPPAARPPRPGPPAGRGRGGRAGRPVPATRGERVLVFGDFDADGLTGLAILVRALRRLGAGRRDRTCRAGVDEGHGLSLRAVEAARDAGRTLIFTVDTGSSSVAEVAAAGARRDRRDRDRPPPRPAGRSRRPSRW